MSEAKLSPAMVRALRWIAEADDEGQEDYWPLHATVDALERRGLLARVLDDWEHQTYVTRPSPAGWAALEAAGFPRFAERTTTT